VTAVTNKTFDFVTAGSFPSHSVPYIPKHHYFNSLARHSLRFDRQRPKGFELMNAAASPAPAQKRSATEVQSSEKHAFRTLPRVEVQSTVLIKLDDGVVVRGKTIDIYPSGMTLLTDALSACEIHPSGSTLNAKNGPKVNIALKLPVAGGEEWLKMRCRVVAHKRTSGNRMIFALLFRSSNGDAGDVVERFIEHALTPPMPE
jgi:hypothetical protein